CGVAAVGDAGQRARLNAGPHERGPNGPRRALAERQQQRSEERCLIKRMTELTLLHSSSTSPYRSSNGRADGSMGILLRSCSSRSSNTPAADSNCARPRITSQGFNNLSSLGSAGRAPQTSGTNNAACTAAGGGPSDWLREPAQVLGDHGKRVTEATFGHRLDR